MIQENDKFYIPKDIQMMSIEEVKNKKDNMYKEMMRDATKEELESVDKYIKSISRPTGINFYDIASPNFVNFKWENRYGCKNEIINSPITLEGKCVGVVTDVDDDYVYGKAFAEVLPELNLNTQTVVSFEFSESWKRP